MDKIIAISESSPQMSEIDQGKFFRFMQRIVALRNPPETIDEAIENDDTETLVKMFMPMYDNATGEFLGVKETLGYIMIRNEPEESFLTYAFSAEHSNKLFCFSKQPIPNIFKGTAFHAHKLQTYADNKAKRSNVFFYLPSITDRKESINRYRDQVSLVPVASTIAEISKFSPENYDFEPAHLEQPGEEYSNAKLTLYRYLKNASRVSNSNLIQNVYALIKKKNIDHASLKWGLSMPKSKVDFGKFCAGF